MILVYSAERRRTLCAHLRQRCIYRADRLHARRSDRSRAGIISQSNAGRRRHAPRARCVRERYADAGGDCELSQRRIDLLERGDAASGRSRLGRDHALDLDRARYQRRGRTQCGAGRRARSFLALTRAARRLFTTLDTTSVVSTVRDVIAQLVRADARVLAVREDGASVAVDQLGVRRGSSRDSIRWSSRASRRACAPTTCAGRARLRTPDASATLVRARDRRASRARPAQHRSLRLRSDRGVFFGRGSQRRALPRSRGAP